MVCRISGDTAIITSPQLRNQSGAVFVFERKGGAWSQVARLVAPDGRPGAMLGSSAEIDGDWIVAGAPQHPMTDQHGSERRVGAVYVWRRTERWIDFPWSDNAEHFEAWKAGMTGYPFVARTLSPPASSSSMAPSA